MDMKHELRVQQILRMYPEGCIVKSLHSGNCEVVLNQIAHGRTSGDIWLVSKSHRENIQVWNPKNSDIYAQIISYPKNHCKLKLMKLWH